MIKFKNSYKVTATAAILLACCKSLASEEIIENLISQEDLTFLENTEILIKKNAFWEKYIKLSEELSP